VPIPLAWSYAYLRHHHGQARRTLVATRHMRNDLIAHGFGDVVIWSRGVDTKLFRPCGRKHNNAPRPISIYVGRVAIEKNLEAFLDAPLAGTKSCSSSRTDTFGLVMLEAMACGTPVAAYPVTGPIDVVQDGHSGTLDEDLTRAAGLSR
jgi:glycosyltransferase involved in cell wall biosynthesis